MTNQNIFMTILFIAIATVTGCQPVVSEPLNDTVNSNTPTVEVDDKIENTDENEEINTENQGPIEIPKDRYSGTFTGESVVEWVKEEFGWYELPPVEEGDIIQAAWMNPYGEKFSFDYMTGYIEYGSAVLGPDYEYAYLYKNDGPMDINLRIESSDPMLYDVMYAVNEKVLPTGYQFLNNEIKTRGYTGGTYYLDNRVVMVENNQDALRIVYYSINAE